MAAVGEAVLADAEPGSSRALHAARLVARTTDDVEGRLRPWAEGRDLPSGLEGDSDFRWIVLGQLARRGLLDAAAIEEARAADQTMSGNLGALTATAFQDGEHQLKYSCEIGVVDALAADEGPLLRDAGGQVAQVGGDAFLDGLYEWVGAEGLE